MTIGQLVQKAYNLTCYYVSINLAINQMVVFMGNMGCFSMKFLRTVVCVWGGAGWNGGIQQSRSLKHSIHTVTKVYASCSISKSILYFDFYLEYISVRIPIMFPFRFPIITTVDVNKSIIAFTVFILRLYKPLRFVRWVWPTFSRSLFSFGFALSPS